MFGRWKRRGSDGATAKLQELERAEAAALIEAEEAEAERLKSAAAAAKVKRVPEYDFPACDSGRELKELWEQYEDNCVEHNMENRYPERSNEVADALQLFMTKFIEVFNYDSYEDLCEEARALVIYPEVLKHVPKVEPESCNTCPGMPCKVVREFANLLLDLFGGYPDTSPGGRSMQYQRVQQRRRGSTHDFTEKTDANQQGNQNGETQTSENGGGGKAGGASESPGNGSASSLGTSTHILREDRPFITQPMSTAFERNRFYVKEGGYFSNSNQEYGLNLLKCAAILVSWAHNRYILQRDLGTHFPDVVIDFMNATIKPYNVESKSENLLRKQDSSEQAEDDVANKDEKDSKLGADDMLLATSALMSLVQILGRIQATSKTFFCFNDFLPCHPWNMNELTLLGFRHFGTKTRANLDATEDILTVSRRASLNHAADNVSDLHVLVAEQTRVNREIGDTIDQETEAVTVLAHTGSNLGAGIGSLDSAASELGEFDRIEGKEQEQEDYLRESSASSIDSDDIEIEIDMGGTSVGLGTMLDDDADNNDWLRTFVTTGGNGSILALTSVLNALTKIINNMAMESQDAKLLLTTLFILEAEVLHTLRIHLHFAPPELSVKEYANWDCQATLGVLLLRRTTETRIDRRNKDSIWTEEDHAFFSHIYLRLGITCFAIVDMMNSYRGHIPAYIRDNMDIDDFPMATSNFAKFLLNMKRDFDSVPIDFIPLADLGSPQADPWGDLSRIKITSEYRAEFEENTFYKSDLWPWTNDGQKEGEDDKSDHASDHYDKQTERKENQWNLKNTIGMSKSGQLLHLVDELKSFGSMPHDFHLVSQLTEEEVAEHALKNNCQIPQPHHSPKSAHSSPRAQPAPVGNKNLVEPRNDHWDWATVGPGPTAWSYLFRSVYRIFCQGHNFKNIRLHKETFEFFIKAFSEAGVPDMLKNSNRDSPRGDEESAAQYPMDESLEERPVLFNQEADPNMIELPLMQYTFLQFMYMIIDTDPIVTLHSLSTSQFWMLLHGPMFLSGGTTTINKYMSAFNCEESKTGNRVMQTFTHGTKPECLQCASWLILHDKVLDLLLAHLKAAFKLVNMEKIKSMTSSAGPPSNATPDPAVLISVMLVISTLNAVPSSDGKYTYNQPSDSVLCSCVKWLKYILSTFPWETYENKKLFGKICMCLTGLSNRQMLVHIGINRLIADRHAVPFNFNEAGNPFLWSARALVIEFLLILTQGSFSSWLLQLIKPDILDKRQVVGQTIAAVSPQPASASSSPSKSGMSLKDVTDANNQSNGTNGMGATVVVPKTPSEEHHLVSLSFLREPLEASNTHPSMQSKVPTSATTAPFAPTISTNEILLLLLDPRFKEAAMHMVFRVLYSCAVKISDIENKHKESKEYGKEISDKEKEKDIQNVTFLRHTIGTLLSGVLDVVTNCATYPPRCDAYNTSLYALGTVTWIMCSSVTERFHHLMKDLMYRTSAVNHLFFALTNCAEGARGKKSNGEPRERARTQDLAANQAAVVQQPMAKIYRQTFSLLTAVMMSHEGNIHAFSTQIRNSTDGVHKNSAEDFTSTLREYEPIPSLETIVVLLEMLTSAAFTHDVHQSVLAGNHPMDVFRSMESSAQSMRYKIVNQAVIPCIFCVLRHCNPGTQLFVLKFFNSLTTGKSSLVNYNLNECSNSNVLDLCIENILYLTEDEVQIQNISLIQTLGRHKITVSDLKYIFKIMQNGQQTGQAVKYHWRLLDSLRDMITDITGPKCKIVFGGQNSGLVLPEVAKWPAMKGLSFCFWFKLEVPTDILGLDDEKNKRRMPSKRRGSELSAISARYRSTKSSVAFTPDLASLYEPHLISMVCADGSGIEVSLVPLPSAVKKFRLILRGYSEKNNSGGKNAGEAFEFEYPEKDKKMPFIVNEGQWHFLAISISPSGINQSSIFGKQLIPATICLDKRIVTGGNFPAPKFGGRVKTVIGDSIRLKNYFETHGLKTGSTHGDDSDDNSNDDEDDEFEDEDERKLHLSFRGQTGAIYFFSHMLTPAQLNSIRELGCDYFYCFEPSTLAPNIRNNPAVDVSIFNEQYGLMKSVMLAYNPAVVKGDLLLNNTPEWSGSGIQWQVLKTGAGDHAEDPGDSFMHAERRNNTFSTTTQDVRKALDSLGGLSALLPILHHIDAGQQKNVKERYMILSSLVSLLQALLRDSKYKVSMMKTLQGFSIISTLMEDISIGHYTPLCLQRFININEFLSTEKEEQDSVEVRNSLLQDILFKMQLWRFTPIVVQLSLLNYITKFTADNPLRARNIMSPNKWMDTIFWTFSYSDENSNSSESDCLLQCGCPEQYLAETRIDIDGTEIIRPTGWERILLRSKLFKMLKMLLAVDSLPEEISHLLGYLVMTRSTQAKLEYLQLLVELLQDPKVAPIVLLGLNYSGAIGSILAFGMHDNVKIRMYSVLIICEIIHISAKCPEMPRVPTGSKYFSPHSTERPKTKSTSTNAYVGSYRRRSQSENSTECLERVGLAPSKLPEILHHLQASLLSKIYQLHHRTKEDNGGDIKEADACATYQVCFIASALLQLSFGISVISMASHIRPREFNRNHKVNLAETLSLNEEAELELANIRKEELASPRSDHVLDYSESFEFSTLRVTDSKYIIAMPIVTLLTFINNEWIPLQNLFDISFLLKTSLTSSDGNSDNLTSLPGWHKCIYDLIVSKAVQYQRIVSSNDGNTAGMEEINVKCRSIEELLTHVLFGLNKTALRIGRSMRTPSASRTELSQMELSPTQINREYDAGYRTIGASTVRETMLFIHSMTVRQLSKESKQQGQKLHSSSIDGDLDFSTRQSIVNEPEYSVSLLRSFIDGILESLDQKNSDLRSQRLEINFSVGKKNLTIRESRQVGIAREDPEILDFQYECKVHLLNIWIFTLTFLNRISKNAYMPSLNAQSVEERKFMESMFDFPLYVYDEVNGSTPFVRIWEICKKIFQLITLGVMPRPASNPTAEKKGENHAYPNFPYCHREGGLYWCLIRILCVALREVIPGKDSHSTVLSAFEKLSSLLDHSLQSQFAFASFEKYYVLAVLSKVTAEYESLSSIEMAAPVMTLFKNLLSQCRSGVLAMLLTALGETHCGHATYDTDAFADLSLTSAATEKDIGDDSGKYKECHSRAKFETHQKTDARVHPILSKDVAFLEELKLILFNESGTAVEFAEIQPDDQKSTDTPGVSVHTMFDIHHKQTKIEVSRLQGLSMRVWKSTMDAVLEQGQMVHLLFEQKCLEELGLGHLNAAVAMKKSNLSEGPSQASTHHSSMGNTTWTMEEFLTTCRLSQDSFYITHTSHLKDLFRSNLKKSKKFFYEGANILRILSSERGPWGQFGYEERSVNWAMDLSDSCRMLLVPENRANQHRTASRIQSSGMNKVDAAEVAVDEVAQAKLLQSNLLQYQTKKAVVVVKKKKDKDGKMIDDDDDNDDDDDDDGDENDFMVPDIRAVSTEMSSANAETELASIIFNEKVQIITMGGGNSKGTLELSRRCLSYKRENENMNIDLGELGNKSGNEEFLWAIELFPSTEWPIEHMKIICERMYQMQPVAVELFLVDRQSVFIAFENAETCKKLVGLIRFINPVNLSWEYFGKGPKVVVSPLPSLGGTKSVQEAWISRDISNYEYLMKLNFIAGRSFNDLSQYPVFPWVIKDYTSKVLDLKKKETFRDFRYPAGAQTKEAQDAMRRYYSDMVEMDDELLSPVHSGSHYSLPGSIYWWLLRVEPFTSMHVYFQSGKFDKPDRLFKSIPGAWASVSSDNKMDAKELIPDFFTNSEFLRNPNNLDLGQTQANEVIGNVQLPAWASNAYDFIEKHKEALESEYVSKNLHHWIDLIFGYKSRPPYLDGGSDETVNACNVFPKSTYQNAYDLSALKNDKPEEYKVTLKIMSEFGQTPQQLFQSPHPERSPLLELDSKKKELLTHDIIWPIASSVPGVNTINFQLPKDASHTLFQKYKDLLELDKPSYCQCHEDFHVSTSSVLFIAWGGELESIVNQRGTLITVDEQRLLGLHPFTRHQNDHIPPYKLITDPIILEVSRGLYKDSSLSNMIKTGLGVSNMRVDRRIGVPYGVSKWGIGDILNSKGKPGKVKASQEQMEAQTKSAIEEEEKNKKNRSRERREKQLQEKAREAKRTEERRHARHTQQQVSSVQSSQPPDSPQPPRSRSDTSSTTSSKSEHPSAPESSPQRSQRAIGYADTSSGESVANASGSNTPTSTPLSSSRPRVSSSSSSSSSRQQQVQQRAEASAAKSSNQSIKSAGNKSFNWEKERPNDHLGSHLFAFLPASKLLFSCFHWDNSFRVTHGETCRLLQTVIEHQEIVTCLALASDLCKHWLLTGSEDSTIMVWSVRPENLDFPIDPVPLYTIHGHDNTVNCIAVNAEIDIIVSGSEDGTMIISTLRNGTYVRTIDFNVLPGAILRKNNPSQVSATPTLAPGANASTEVVHKPAFRKDSVRSSGRINLIAISKEGYIVAYSAQGHILSTYSLNSLETGGPIRRIVTGERLYCMKMSEDGKVLMTGGAYCLVILRWVFSLGLANDGSRTGLEAVLDGSQSQTSGSQLSPFNSPIRSLYMTPKEAHLFVGLESGHVRILAQDSEYLRQRLHKRLELTGFLK